MSISDIQSKMTRKDWDRIIIPITVMVTTKQPTNWIVSQIQRKFGMEEETIKDIMHYVMHVNNSEKYATDLLLWKY